MPEQLFDRAAEYEAMLNQGISLSGENQEFFIAGRIQDMRSQVPPNPRRILDFGCGTGKSCAYLADVFPQAHVVGADLSEDALRHATASFGSNRREIREHRRFAAIGALRPVLRQWSFSPHSSQ